MGIGRTENKPCRRNISRNQSRQLAFRANAILLPPPAILQALGSALLGRRQEPADVRTNL
jgi:hypothetical protein